MELSKHQIEEYQELGFLFIEDIFSSQEIDHIIEETLLLQQKDGPDVVWEEDRKHVRALLGSHLKSALYKRLIAQSRLVEPVQQLLNTESYVYQFKINTKLGFSGQVWPWHQDFIYWHLLDGMPNAHVVNMTIFLDECTEFNGSLWLIPESHKSGLIQPKNRDRSNGWQSDVSADLTFQISNEKIQELVKNKGIEAPKGKAGSVLIFHPNIVHASPPNISPYSRRLLIITYNSVENVPINQAGQARPAFLVNPDTTPQQVMDLEL